MLSIKKNSFSILSGSEKENSVLMVPFYYWPTHYYNLPALEIFSEPRELANMGKEAVSGWEKETKAHPFG